MMHISLLKQWKLRLAYFYFIVDNFETTICLFDLGLRPEMLSLANMKNQTEIPKSFKKPEHEKNPKVPKTIKIQNYRCKATKSKLLRNLILLNFLLQLQCHLE